MYRYTCKYTHEDGTTEFWKAKICPMRMSSSIYEAEITARGTTLDVLIGDYRHGRFICIPDINVGCPLSRYDDLFWNIERLSVQMNTIDAVTVACGVKVLMEQVEIARNNLT